MYRNAKSLLFEQAVLLYQIICHTCFAANLAAE
jgi:hypothetical protein